MPRQRWTALPNGSVWHALVCGAAGAGKSSGFFLPNLFGRVGTSAIVTEATTGFEPPELYKKTAGWQSRAGRRIYAFNPTDMTSTRINPMELIRKAPPEDRDAAADSLANLVILNTTS